MPSRDRRSAVFLETSSPRSSAGEGRHALSVLSQADADVDGKLDYAELATGLVDEETTEYLQELGIKDAVALMEQLVATATARST